MCVINLDRSTDRLARFKARNSHLRDVIRCSAIDGATIDRQQLIASGHIKGDLPYSSGTLGCALSHIALWELAVKQNTPVTIFEDDIVVHPQFTASAALLFAGLKDDWDVVQWGCWITTSNMTAWVDLGGVEVRIDATAARKWKDDAGYVAFKETLVNGAVPIRLLHCFGTFAYSISPRGARLALDYCIPLRERMVGIQNRWWMKDNGIDVAMCGLYPQIKAHLCFPQLVVPCLDVSDRKAADAGKGTCAAIAAVSLSP